MKSFSSISLPWKYCENFKYQVCYTVVVFLCKWPMISWVLSSLFWKNPQFSNENTTPWQNRLPGKYLPHWVFPLELCSVGKRGIFLVSNVVKAPCVHDCTLHWPSISALQRIKFWFCLHFEVFPWDWELQRTVRIILMLCSYQDNGLFFSITQ